MNDTRLRPDTPTLEPVGMLDDMAIGLNGNDGDGRPHPTDHGAGFATGPASWFCCDNAGRFCGPGPCCNNVNCAPGLVPPVDGTLTLDDTLNGLGIS